MKTFIVLNSRPSEMIGHLVDRLTAFTIIYTHPNPYLLKYAEATAVGLERSNLCKQKDFIMQLKLPWGNKERAA